MTKTHADYYDALHSEEAVRISNAIYSLLEDYVRYFNSQGFQIRRDWIDEAFSAATSVKWVRGGGPEEDYSNPSSSSTAASALT
jgi:predicted Zn-dependent protease